MGAGTIRWIIALSAAGAIEAACRLGLVNPKLLVAPSEMAVRLASILGSGEFWSHVADSARSIVVAFLLANLFGSLIGLVLHRFARLRAALEPLIASYYAIPFFVLYPLMIVFFGMNRTPIILIGYLYAVMAVIVGTLSGLDRIPPVLRKTGRVMRLSAPQQALTILLPATGPYLLTGAKLALSYSITGVLGSEFILATSGFGYRIALAYNAFDDRTMYAHLLFLLVIVTVVTLLMHKVQSAVHHRSGPGQGGESASAAAKLAASLAVAAIIILAWQLAHAYAGEEAIASPAASVVQLWRLLGSEKFIQHVAETSYALALSLLISCLAGAVIGLVLGSSRVASEVAEPMIVALYSLPKIALYPVVLLLFGIGLSAKVAFGAIHGIFPMLLISMNAIRSMNPTLVRTARAMRLSRLQTLATVTLPATIPEIVTGLRISFSVTLLGVMVGEMFASSRGLGFMIMNSINANDTSTMMAVTVLVTVFAVGVNWVLLAFDRALHHA